MIMCRALSYEENTLDKSRLRKISCKGSQKTITFPSPCFYVDDGFSGGNFQRPAFQQMIADMENGEIGIIVTKDLSQPWTETSFTPVSTLRNAFRCSASGTLRSTTMWTRKTAESNDLMPFKNLFNEWFIRDTSRKIRAVQKSKAERGERLGTRAPYGYVKDLETKKLLDRRGSRCRCETESSPCVPRAMAPAGLQRA